MIRVRPSMSSDSVSRSMLIEACGTTCLRAVPAPPLRASADTASRLVEKRRQPLHAVLESNRRHDTKALAHRAIDRSELDVLVGAAFVANRHAHAKRARH